MSPCARGQEPWGEGSCGPACHGERSISSVMPTSVTEHAPPLLSTRRKDSAGKMLTPCRYEHSMRAFMSRLLL